MNHIQIIEEMNLNLNHQTKVGFEGMFEVINFLYDGAYDEVFLELSQTNSSRKVEE